MFFSFGFLSGVATLHSGESLLLSALHSSCPLAVPCVVSFFAANGMTVSVYTHVGNAFPLSQV